MPHFARTVGRFATKGAPQEPRRAGSDKRERDSGMSILVTGGAGYIGSHTVRLLRERGRDVVVIDTLEFGHVAALGDTPLVQADIADRQVVAEVVRDHDVDAVMHFAAYKAAGESMERPGKYFHNNVAGSSALLETLEHLGVKRLIFSSSCAVYGTPDALPVSEVSVIRPESPYGESKAIIERLLSWNDRCLGLRSVSLRYFNAAGAWPDGSIGEDWTVTLNLVPLIMKTALGRGARCMSSAPTIPPRTAQLSVTTCMCSTWRRLTSERSNISRTMALRRRSISAPVWARQSSKF